MTRSFVHIYELSPGDEIVVDWNGQTFRYAVTGKNIVKPEDVSVLQPTSDAELTLITCYPTYYVGPDAGEAGGVFQTDAGCDSPIKQTVSLMALMTLMATDSGWACRAFSGFQRFRRSC